MDMSRLWRTCFRIAYDDSKRYKAIAIVEGVVIIALVATLVLIMFVIKQRIPTV